MDNVKLTKEFLFNIASRIIRYAILMNAPDSDVILANEMDFKIENEPFYYIVTFNNIEDDEEGVTHRYEHILRIAKRDAQYQYTMNDYVKVIDLYEAECDKVIGVRWDGTSSPGNLKFIDVNKHFNVGDEIVTRYASYGSHCMDILKYRDDDHVVHTKTVFHYAPELMINYAKYDHDEYDEDGNLIHAYGEVMLDDNKQIIWNYIESDKQSHWQLVNTIQDNTQNTTIQEPLD